MYVNGCLEFLQHEELLERDMEKFVEHHVDVYEEERSSELDSRVVRWILGDSMKRIPEKGEEEGEELWKVVGLVMGKANDDV